MRRILPVLLLGWAVAAHAGDREAMDAYKKGVAAVQAGKHADAVKLLQSALAERGEEGSFKIGVMNIEYAPSRWLAEAYLGTGDCAAARKALEKAQGVKMGAREKAGLDALVAKVQACGQSAPPVAQASAPPTPVPPPVKAACAGLAEARTALRDGDLAKARRLASGCVQADATDVAARQVLEEVDSLLGAKVARARREEAAGNDAAALALAREVLAIDPDDADAKVLAERLKGAAAGPTAVAAATAPARATAPAGATAQAQATAPRATTPGTAPAVGAALPPGIAAFFRGDVDASIRALELDAATPETLTVLACALATRGLIAGEPSAGAADLDRARQAWRQARSLKPGLTLDARWVSPRIREALQ